MSTRLALTMRVMRSEYGEYRDALAQDWGRFMRIVLPRASWIPVPNVGEGAVALLEDFGVDGLIFTGGDDWGVYPLRDATEQALFSWAVGRIPILGICRGAQIINTLSGGKLAPIRNHVAVRHSVTLDDQPHEVNSFHKLSIPDNGLGQGLISLAQTSDGSIEAFGSRHLVMGVMWHPEREMQPAPHDIRLVRQLFDQD